MRDSLKGWLGGGTPEEWVKLAHGDEKIDCHVHLGAQCAGGAIYRRNVSKLVRDPEILTLNVNKRDVFDSPTQFLEHHGRR